MMESLAALGPDMASWVWALLVGTMIAVPIFRIIFDCRFLRALDEEIQVNRVVVITGCDRGLGYHTAKVLVEAGFVVIAGCLSEEGMEGLKAELGGTGKIITIKCDVCNESHVENLRLAAETAGNGRIHAVVNNAGIASCGDAYYTPMKDFDAVLAVNLQGAIRVTKACLPGLLRTRGSRVIFISSLAGLGYMWGASAYCASKYGLEGFAGALRLELKGFGVQVVSVNPGFLKTDMGLSFPDLFVRAFEKAGPEVKGIYGEDFGRKLGSAAAELRKTAGDPMVAVRLPPLQPVEDTLLLIPYSLRLHPQGDGYLRHAIQIITPIFD
ncbi:unnamed protein product [Discosporangium mesarthrocarpum]